MSNAVELRFDAAAWDALPPAARPRLRRLAGRRMTDEGLIVIDAQRFRSLEQNRADALERLVDDDPRVARRAEAAAADQAHPRVEGAAARQQGPRRPDQEAARGRDAATDSGRGPVPSNVSSTSSTE